MKEKKESYFWASYADLMTSLFFVMLVLFVLTIALLHKRMVEIDNERRLAETERIATEAELIKIHEVQNATRDIDSLYFEYRPEYKKHKLRTSVWFSPGSSNMDNIIPETQMELAKAGRSLKQFVEKNAKDSIQYLLIIEGQASRDNFSRNYQLSYERALALKVFWEQTSGISFGENCEVLICGSGDGKLSGTDFMREADEKSNQRFLIHIVPKHGEIDTMQNGKIKPINGV